MNFSTFVRDYLPDWIHSLAISVFNYLQYRQRHSGELQVWHQYFKKWQTSSRSEWEMEQLHRLQCFIDYAKKNSPYYIEKLKDIEINSLYDLQKIKPIKKTQLRDNINQIVTILPKAGIISETGGTTGNSLTVYFTTKNFQERFALLKLFREAYGYRLGTKSVWFSGKELLSQRDIKKGKYYKDDFLQKIRYFSTFHITDKSFDDYWRDFNAYSPLYLFGFPSSVVDLCTLAKRRGYKAKTPVITFFSTSEVISHSDVSLIRDVLGCNTADQYASAEGAPLILDCKAGKKHIQPLTGVFEIVDENLRPAHEGELLVTSFTSYGTPLIRYRIGDRIKLSKDQSCICNCTFPIVEAIAGRTQDYLVSATGAKINAVNISNSSKHINGIIRFQAVQEAQGIVTVKVLADSSFTVHERMNFIQALQQRLGESTHIEIKSVDELPREMSGKFRVVINKVQNCDTL